MTITNRLSLYFLAALAVVLLGFSATLYLLAAQHLRAQEVGRAEAALHTLVAATEIHPDDVEWEPLERRVTLGAGDGAEEVRWAVHDLHGRLIDCSANLERADSAAPAVSAAAGWRLVVRRVAAGRFEAESVDGQADLVDGPMPDGFVRGAVPGATALPADRTFHGTGLIFTVAVSTAPMRSTLRQLALALLGVSGLLWLTAAVWGRWLCRRALEPIFAMAASARAIRAQRASEAFLQVQPTGDELEELARAFNDLLGSLRDALERQRRFSGDASHQLRTPLTAILGKVDVALRKERTLAEYQQVLGVVHRRGQQLQKIIESLLFLARAEAAAPLPETETFELGAWCAARLEAWAEQPRAGDIVCPHSGAAVWVRTQQTLLGQVLDNLLDNACKYSTPGTPIVVTWGREGEFATLAVADRGCGIEPNEQALVLHPFYRSRQARWLGTPGAGLGLSLADRLVGMMGGKLRLFSQPGQGSNFIVVLPAAVVELMPPVPATLPAHPGMTGV